MVRVILSNGNYDYVIKSAISRLIKAGKIVALA
jgi:hypothetical protein